MDSKEATILWAFAGALKEMPKIDEGSWELHATVRGISSDLTLQSPSRLFANVLNVTR